MTRIDITTATLQAQSTIAGALQLIARTFEQAGLYYGHGTGNAYDDAGWLVAWALGIDYADTNWGAHFESRLNDPIDTGLAITLSDCARRRIEQRTPMAYVLGEAWFAGHRFIVNEQVLVPRSPIAELIAQNYQPWCDLGDGSHILDLCTGSGCIAVASALALPGCRVDASDVSSQALAVAADNIALHGVGDRVRLIEADLFQSDGFGRYDLIITNPPYVDAAEMDARPVEYQHEPSLGLAAGNDGLDIARVILDEAAAYLTDQGVLIMEVGASDEALQDQYINVPFTWLEFADDVRGVCVLTKRELLTYAETFEMHRKSEQR